MNKDYELPPLISRCLSQGIQISTYEQRSVLKRYDQYKMPDNLLNKLSKDDIIRYVKGLCLSGVEDAIGWSKGHSILKSLGFVETQRREGHRVFVRLSYPTEVEEGNDDGKN